MNTKRFMNWVSGSGSPNQLEIDGKLVSKASSIAAAMNNYFIEKVAAVRRDILCFPNTYSECLHKKDSRLDKRNYRPVAILSPISKILEKVVFQQIYEYFTRNKIFDDNLHGYRKKSTNPNCIINHL